MIIDMKLSKILTVLTFFILGVSYNTFAATLPGNNVTSPVQLTLDNGDLASGFFLRDTKKLYFVTARHVLFSKDEVSKKLILKATNGHILCYSGREDFSEKIEFDVNFEALYQDGKIKPHNDHDVVVIYVSDYYIDDSTGKDHFRSTSNFRISSGSPLSGIITSYITDIIKFDKVEIGNDIYIFGYPSSIGIIDMLQIDAEKPLTRKGIVSGKNIKNKTIIIDCPVYNGNSGGPVIQAIQLDAINKSYLRIGVVSEFVPFSEEWLNKKHGRSSLTVVFNTGYSVVEPIDFVLELLTWK